MKRSMFFINASMACANKDMLDDYLDSLGIWGPWDVEREGDEPLHEGKEVLQYPGSDWLLW